MKKLLLAALLGFSVSLTAQETVLPAKAQTDPIYIINAIIHTGNGTVIEKGTIRIEAGKIVAVGDNIPVPRSANIQVVDAAGKHVYPGLILPTSALGLVEISAVRATQDAREIGDMNPSIRSIVAYNTDSKVINTLKSNGITHANIVPEGATISGTSSVVQLDAWNWEDAAYATDNGVHLNMPALFNRPNRFAAFLGTQGPQVDPIKRGLEQIEEIKSFFREANAYLTQTQHSNVNLKFESIKGLYTKKQKLFIHCDVVREILAAIDFKNEFDFESCPIKSFFLL